MTSRLLLACAFGICAALCVYGQIDAHAAAATPNSPATGVPLAMLPRAVIPTHYRLALTIDPAKAAFNGHAEIEVDVWTPQASFFMDGLDLHVSRAIARLPSGKVLPATFSQIHDSGVARLTFTQPLSKGRATLIFDYDAPFNTSLAGLYKVVDHGDAYAFTQFENIDARRAFPSFDEPGFKAPFDVTVIAPAADKVVGNTPVVSSAPAGEGMTKWVFETTKPLPTYLVALAVGPLDIVDAGDIPPNQYRDRPLHLRGVAARGKGARLKYALSLTPSVIEALERYYGIGYPFPKVDILAVPDFSAGAMENAGAVTFREQLLLMDDSAPREQKRSSLTVQAHELAHQWFGDLVTPHWWDDIWLNESFATWMEYKIAQTVRPDQDFSEDTLKSSLGVMRLDELPSARQIHNPVQNPDDIDNAFDDITYSKGAAVLSMFEHFIGPAEFQKGIHDYLTKFAYRNATATDFIGMIAQTTGHPEIVRAFDDFIDQPHIPLLGTDLLCGNTSPRVRLDETMYLPVGIAIPERRWHVPVCISADGTPSCQLAGPPQASIAVGGKCPAVVFPNDKGAGYYRFGLPNAQWHALIDRAAQLSPADRLTLLHNASAALRAGTLGADEYYGLIAKLAPVADWNLVATDHRDSFDLIDELHDLRVTGVLTREAVARQQAFVREHFGPRLKHLGLAARAGERVKDSLARQYLAELLVTEGHDPPTIAPLAKAAQLYLASGGKNLGALPPELLEIALRAGAMSLGNPFADSLIDALQKSDDEYFVQSAIYALAGTEDRTTLDKVLALALTPAVRTGDLRYVQRYFGAEPLAREALWAWFKRNFAAIEKRLSRYGMASTPDIQKFGCDARSKADLNAFFAPKTAELVGTPRTLRENEDRIDRCIAFKAAKAGDIASALAAVK